VNVNSFRAIKRTEARQRMAALRRARKSRRAAIFEQQRSALIADAAKWKMTNLAEVLRAMA